MIDIAKTNTEVFEILNILGKEYINKIPVKLYNYIAYNRNKNSILEYDINENILEQGISNESRDFIAYLNVKYWCNDDEKRKLLEQYKRNDIEYEKKLEERYNVDVFANRRKINTREDIHPVKQEENKIKMIFRKIKEFICNKIKKFRI